MRHKHLDIMPYSKTICANKLRHNFMSKSMKQTNELLDLHENDLDSKLYLWAILQHSNRSTSLKSRAPPMRNLRQ